MMLHARIAAVGLVAVLAAGLAAPTATAEPRTADRRAPFAATLAASSEQAVAGRWLVLRGTVAPATKGTTVVLQKRVRNKKWVDEARLRTTSKGTFRYRDRPHVAGVRTYRVVVPAAGGVSRGTSVPVTITVYKWQSLTKVQPRKNLNTWSESGGSINGVPYEPVIQGNPTNPTVTEGFSDWNLNRQCLSLRATVGNGDASETNAVATITLSGDATNLYTRSFGLTESEARTFDLTDVFRLTFSWTASNPAGGPTAPGGAQAMLAEPEVLCAF
ncbi:hypothetical protein GON03_21085 [Nocardioides sp. MAH-18]|uniref:Glycosyl hydrolase family 98 putative carbohydrate-binding module domain-containing protein n=1 Tax=Nocardioides agri TaxID=2682843 RepID=A0A6L6XY14_9ACTN|nr:MULTISPECIES: hypothetical protein [unclassified Nocardioides]MBA2952519.1 hypothetical protein [Nocardioides sp. CGMCC 1.13656]MVQ51682.1 hypothetical protein [Nocardioides sp. MAH-18]